METVFLKSECCYASHYCEENVYKLCEKSLCKDDFESFAVIVSNSNKSIPIWCQSLSKDSSSPVVWDYHVILVLVPREIDKKSVVYDFDTTLAFGMDGTEYCCLSFRPELNLPAHLSQVCKENFVCS